MIDQLLEWLDESTCNVLAINTIEAELKNAGFTELSMSQDWQILPGARHYVKQNGTAIFAFIQGNGTAPLPFHIISSHSDSPCFKLKPNCEIKCEGGLVKLNVEKYGGGIMYTWFDRPLSISGRVALRGESPLTPELVSIDFRRPVATIPHLAIHFNRAVNEGNPLSAQSDMLPVLGTFTDEELDNFDKEGGIIRSMIAKQLQIDTEDILDYELCLYPVEPAGRTGLTGDLYQSARIDDLSMAFASLRALLDTADIDTEATRVMAVFDNEETGSGTKQGAGSPILAEILLRLTNGNPVMLSRSVAQSFMISADNAHAWHPNYNSKYDPTNHALMGQGPAIKINANCKYMTDAESAAVFRAICEEAEVPCQYFVNHSDVAGGSTLGNILTGQLPLRGVDMGAPIWAMHSARETASCQDHEYIVAAFTHYYSL